MLILFIVIVIILISIFYRRSIPVLEGWQKYLLISLRSISMITLLFLIINPIMYFTRTQLLQPAVIVLNDTSESMIQTGVKATKQDLYELKKNEIINNLHSAGHKVLESDFADGIDGDKTSTNLSKTLIQTFKKYDPQNILAILLVSDGWFNDDELEIMDQQNIPVYTIDPQFKSDDLDIMIQDVQHNRSVFIDEPTPIKVFLTAQNFTGKAKLELISNQKKVVERELNFNNEESKQIVLEPSFTEEGFAQINLNVKTDSSDVNLDNNSFQTAIQVKRNHSQNLIISDKLSWDTKFIVSALNRDQRWKSKFLLKKELLYFADQTTKLEDELINANVLTLINYGNLSLSQNETDIINRFAENGGGLLMLGMPIDEIDENSPALRTKTDIILKSTFNFTKQSKKYNTFSNISKEDINNIPPVSYYIVRPKLESTVLAEFNDDSKNAAILFSKFNKGKLLTFNFINLWKWQLWNSGNAYNDLMLNIFSWLGQTESQRFYSTLNKNAFYIGEDIQIDLYAFDETLNPINDIDAELSVINSANKTVHKGFFINKQNKQYLTISDLPAGNYSYEIKDKISDLKTDGNFVVSDISPESRDLGINLELLSYISNTTGGKVITELSEINFPKVISKTIKIRSEIPIYKKWYIIAIFLVAFCTELLLRKRWGLL